MADLLTGGYRFDPFLNEYIGDVTEQNTTSGQAIKINKPIHITFEKDENFKEALLIEGEVNISDDTVMGSKLDVSGDMYVGGNLKVVGHTTSESYTTKSDLRYKDHIEKLPHVDLAPINVYRYRLKRTKRMTYGVLAQELLTTPGFEHMVFVNKQGMQSVDYIQFIPIMINEIKTIKRTIAFSGILVVSLGLLSMFKNVLKR